jgi:uncharacterized protein
MFRITIVLSFCSILMTQCDAPSEAQSGNHKYTNKLAGESSPYLLQHAHNPVDWYPWGEEALAKAQKEKKLLIISIGYAACHWCHVMEHESFEDSTVAALMNEHFVSIKVDREERPDVDDVYMTACQMASGRGCGWPLNAFALADGRPVWAGTYFPKNEWMRILKQFADIKANDPDKLTEYATQLTEGIQGSGVIQLIKTDSEFEQEALDNIADQFIANVDRARGGRSGAPKFPMPNNWEFLMRYAFMKDDPAAKDAVIATLDNMAGGGIYDHVGGGFARYSTDAKWHVPHFEKMLYDNGQLVSLYSHAFQWTGDPVYERTVRQTLQFIERELTDPSGGFYSSLDADSEGEEGKSYVWTSDEIDAILANPELNKLARDYFDIKPGGNWEHKKNILQVTKTDEAFAKMHDITVEELLAQVERIKALLLSERNKRVGPALDDKILTGWNGLMLKGYVDAYRALGDQEYLDKALENAQFIESEMLRPDGGLNRNYKDGKSVINAFLDDYAIVIDAWISLYQVTFEEEWLTKAKKLADYSLKHFFDDKSGMFFYTSDLDPPLIARKKEVGDNVIPASNSIMAKDLHKLGLFLYDQEYLDVSRQMLHNMAPGIVSSQQPSFFSNWCDLYADQVWPLFEVAIVGKDHVEKNREMMRHYLPQSIFLGGAVEGGLELLTDKLQEGATVIYVCQNKVCKFPVSDVNEAIKLME